MKTTNELVTGLYPIVAKSLEKNTNKFKQCVGTFVERRSTELYDTCPCDRIYFGTQELTEFYSAMGFTEKDVNEQLQKTFFYPLANMKKIVKDEFTIAMIMVIRYFYLKKLTKETELAATYLAFSGKFYPSIHYGRFPKVQPSEHRHVMEYVVNSELTNKFDLKREGSIFGAVRSICATWIDSYGDRIKDCDDDDIVYIVQQLHNRIKSFLTNIAEVYYKVYKDKDHYLSFDSDNLSTDNYRIADNDSLKTERAVEKTVTYLNTSKVDYKICQMASDSNVRPIEVHNIVETILNDNDNLPEVKELISLITIEYMVNSKDKDIKNIDFISTSITPKPNTKNPNILREKEIVEDWLNENSPSYRKRRSREATKSSYHKSVITYFTLCIYSANK
ncbi:MAG: hypothetical protein M0P49_05785 [Bacilli bacterium]|nr:hypothetical protein [Bacilli bacterium]